VLVHRFDVAALGKAERTPQGFLRIPGYLTRVGVLEYRRADGQVVRELRPREEVFRAQSLATLSAAPVTDLHPTQMVTPQNVQALQVGHVGDEVKADGLHVAAHVTIQEAKAIAAVESGERRELSCGYQCRIDTTPGTYEGQAYDQVQRDIVYNHVAIGPRNWGRAGRDVALRVDAKDDDAAADGGVFRLDQADAVSVATTAPPGGGHMEPVTIHVDGIDVQVVTKQGAQLIEKALETRNDVAAQAVTERDEVRAELATANDPKRIDALVEARMNDPKVLGPLVKARTVLIEKARTVLAADYKFDDASSRQIQEAVLVHLDSTFDPKGCTPEVIGARFDGVMSQRTGTEDRTQTNLDDARRLTAPPAARKQPAARTDAEQAGPDWQKPLSYSKARTKQF
jgi:uncharacterized protein